ncbi:MAG TPA: universal stress protein [Terriglobales bacterium]|jgi:nucleotide-binding universal stress UspA family protein|nr:universal stress protein [Terriglobales bacterium]
MSQVGISKAIDIQLSSILLATDFSAASEGALHHAIAIARHFNARLYLVHIVSSLGLTMAGPEAISTSTSLAQRDAASIERKLILNGTLRELHHQVIVRAGDIWEELEHILRHEHIDLAVIGTHSRTGVMKLVLGSVAEQIFRHAFCPVLTVGPHSPLEAELPPRKELRPLLFPTDFSDASLAALPYAITFANQIKTQLVLVHLLSHVPPTEGTRWYTADDVMCMRKEAQVAAAQQLEQLTVNAGLGMKPLCIAKVADAAEGILLAARALHVSCIIMGLHRKKHIDLASHLPWSTAHEVVCGADCPVLTVRSSQ